MKDFCGVVLTQFIEEQASLESCTCYHYTVEYLLKINQLGSQIEGFKPKTNECSTLGLAEIIHTRLLQRRKV